MSDIDMMPEKQTLTVGGHAVEFVPHALPGVGARIFVVLDTQSLNLSPDDARRFAERLKIAACQADTKARRKHFLNPTATEHPK